METKILIREATASGYASITAGGVADLSYPNSKTRRGRVQRGGAVSPTLTTNSGGICALRVCKVAPVQGCYCNASPEFNRGGGLH